MRLSEDLAHLQDLDLLDWVLPEPYGAPYTLGKPVVYV
jgi:hypothetical protein